MTIRRSKSIMAIFILLFAMLTIFAVPFSAHAENGVPDNAPVYSGDTQEPDPNKPKKPDANDVFAGAEVGPDSSGYADGAGALLSKITNFLVALINYCFAFALVIHFSVDALMMAFPIFATFFATKVPFQIFSHEAAKVCGVKYSYKPGGAGGVGGVGGGVGTADAGGGVGGAGDTKQKGFIGKVVPYLKERMFTLIICGALLVMSATGILPWLINTAINWLIGLFIK